MTPVRNKNKFVMANQKSVALHHVPFSVENFPITHIKLPIFSKSKFLVHFDYLSSQERFFGNICLNFRKHLSKNKHSKHLFNVAWPNKILVFLQKRGVRSKDGSAPYLATKYPF